MREMAITLLFFTIPFLVVFGFYLGRTCARAVSRLWFHGL